MTETRLSVANRRRHWGVWGAGWVCDRCGSLMEDGMCMWATGRPTRSDPEGGKVVVYCHWCEDRQKHGCFVDA